MVEGVEGEEVGMMGEGVEEGGEEDMEAGEGEERGADMKVGEVEREALEGGGRIWRGRWERRGEGRV